MYFNLISIINNRFSIYKCLNECIIKNSNNQLTKRIVLKNYRIKRVKLSILLNSFRYYLKKRE